MKKQNIIVVLCPTCEGGLLMTNLKTPSKDFVKNMGKMVMEGAVVEHWPDMKKWHGCTCGYIEKLREKMA